MASKTLCRLCVEEIEPLFDIFGDFGRENQIQEIVAQHFWFELREDDPLSDKICTICWGKLVDFHAFFYQVQKAQERITMIDIEDEIKPNEAEFDEGLKHEIIIKSIDAEADGNVVLATYKIDSSYDQEISGKFDSCSTRSDSDQTNIETYAEISTDNLDDDGYNYTNESAILSDQNERLIRRKDELQSNDDDSQSTFHAKIENAGDIGGDNKHVEYLRLIENVYNDDVLHEEMELREDFREQKHFKSRSKFTKNRCKISVEAEETIHATADSCTDGNTRKKKGKAHHPKRRLKLSHKQSPEEQKQREIELIESYYKMQCDLCKEDLGGFEKLFDHYNDVHQLRGSISCCGRQIVRRCTIAEHILWHRDPKSFTCTACDMIFANKRRYDNHMIIHAPPDVPIYRCDYCPKTFSKKYNLEKHKLSHLKDEEKKYMCDECGKPYASESLLRAHTRVVHLHTYAHICEICARVFKSRVFFEKHLLEHLGKDLPKVQCHICDAWLKNEHSFRAHMRNHQDEGQEHKCDICGKTGPSRNAIAKHKRFVHLSERKFKCKLCDKAFKRAITLKEHMTVHTGEVLYTCAFCPKTFNSGANMHAHQKKMHPIEWLEDKRNKMELPKTGSEAN